jgi:Arc/MetJ-type ribon-helix-helix transcriptional regulator
MASRDNSREGRAMVSVWLDLPVLAEIDQAVAEMQRGRKERVHRSDVIREALQYWVMARKERSAGEGRG